MTASFGIGMFIYGIICIAIGATAVYHVINKLNKTPEQIEQEENEKYLNELKGKLGIFHVILPSQSLLKVTLLYVRALTITLMQNK